jgi:hypothetical protein
MKAKRLIGLFVAVIFVTISACSDDTEVNPNRDGSVIDANTADLNTTGDTKPTGDTTGDTTGDFPIGDAITTGDAGDANTSDANTSDANTMSDAILDTSGWVPNDGPVTTTDSQVIISPDGGGPKWVCTITKCAGKTLECGDCVDNDSDGLVDWKDPECLGPCDNTEGPALIGGIGGGTSSNCFVDCYFDFGNGPGNDQCLWDHKCDPLEPEKSWGCNYDVTMLGTKKCPTTQSATCAKVCLPYTPNGCDCFGCCTFPALKGLGPAGSDGHVWIGAMDTTTKKGTCTFNDILDKAKCPRCTPVQGCNNPCGKCEICIGKPTLPPECYKPPTPDAGPVPDSMVGKDFTILVPDAAPVPDSMVGKDSYMPPDAPSGDFGVIVPPILQCPGGEQPCSLPGQAPCPPGTHYCISGCCQPVQIN